MRPLRNLLIALLAMSALSGIAAATDVTPPSKDETPQSTLVMQVDGTIVVTAQGDVADYHVSTAITPSLQAMVDRAARRWKFEPPLINGTPQLVSTKVRVVLTAAKVADGYAVKIDDVVFLDNDDTKVVRVDGAFPLITARRVASPDFPAELNMAHKSATILLAVMLDGDGKVEKVAVVQSMLHYPIGPASIQAADLRVFERSALRGATRWSYNVPEGFGQRAPEDRVGTVTVNYIIPGIPGMDGKWCPVARLPRHDISWLDDSPHAQRAGAAAVAAGELVPAKSPLKLLTNVAGAALN